MNTKVRYPLPTRTTIEIHLNGKWVPAADVQIMGSERCRVDYLASYLFSNDPVPISLSMPLTYDPDQLVLGIEVDGKLERRPPPFMYDLVPQGQGRKYLVGELGLADDVGIVMPLVALGAFNPIGNLRLRSAVEFYEQQLARNPTGKEFNGVTLKDISERADEFLEHIALHAMLASGTTGVQGVAPKFLLNQDAENLWYADLALADDRVKSHWLVKLPRGASDADKTVLRNEQAYLQVAQKCGLRVKEAPMMVGDMLFLRRFDREVVTDGMLSSVKRLHQESLASIAGLRGFGPASSQNELLNALRQCCDDPITESIEFIKRDVLNLALRNTDNHARNTAVQRTSLGKVQLTPLYDFAPMFMDPEVVPRSLYWRNADSVRLNQWTEIIDSLDVTDSEREQIAMELKQFAEQVGNLESIARDCGVSSLVLNQCLRSIETQANQLTKIDPPANTAKASEVQRG